MSAARPVGLRRHPARRTPRQRPGRSWNWTAIAAVIAALAPATGVYFTGRSLEATRTQNATIEQGQLTDRFTKAVDQLDRTGTDHLQARLGAIYGLERLARDSPQDQPTIIEVHSAFIRTTTPRPIPAADGSPRSAMTCPTQVVAPDIQAALTVLGRRNAAHDQNSRIDLLDTCLVGANLSSANLVGAALVDADLGAANLSSAYLSRANLRGARLISTDLRTAYLPTADSAVRTSAARTSGMRSITRRPTSPAPRSIRTPTARGGDDQPYYMIGTGCHDKSYVSRPGRFSPTMTGRDARRRVA